MRGLSSILYRVALPRVTGEPARRVRGEGRRTGSPATRGIGLLLLVLLNLPALAVAAAPPATAPVLAPATGPRVTLVTVGPGDAVWERFGHNMIRFEDPADGYDVCYNWGVFDFDRPGFIPNFIRGRMLYSMIAADTQAQLQEYQQQNRRVTFQVLNLTRSQLRDLVVRCETNRQPANRDYRYDYFRDNCSTRVRDVLDGVYGGEPGRRANKGVPLSPTLTYRTAFMRLMQDDFFTSLAADFALGPAVDRPLDEWDACFLPEQVMALVAPDAQPAAQAWTSTRPLPAAGPPRRAPGLALAGVLIAAVLLLLARSHRRRTLGLLAGAWWLLSGFGGWFMVYAWTTDHTAAYANQNLWHYSPLAWAVLALLLARRRAAAGWAAWLIVVVSVVGVMAHLAGVLVQQNLGFMLLALPVNAAAAFALTRRRAGDEVADHANAPADGRAPDLADVAGV